MGDPLTIGAMEIDWGQRNKTQTIAASYPIYRPTLSLGGRNYKILRCM